MKNYQKALIRSFLSKRIILSMFVLFFSKFGNCQQIFKFKELPVKLQNSVIANLQKRLLDTSQGSEIFISDTVTVPESYSKKVFKLFNYHLRIDSVSLTDTNKVVITCTSSIISIGYGEDLMYIDRRLGYYDRRYETVARLSFTCMDSSHNPHHSATTLKQMMKLRDKYHCKKIETLIIDDN